MPRGHAENRNMVFPMQRGAVACYRHEKFNPSPASAIDDFPTPALALGPCIETVRRMAATRTRDIFGTGRAKIAIDRCTAAIRGRGIRRTLGGAAMIMVSIFWALVFALFVTKTERPNEYQKQSRKRFRARLTKTSGSLLALVLLSSCASLKSTSSNRLDEQIAQADAAYRTLDARSRHGVQPCGRRHRSRDRR